MAAVAHRVPMVIGTCGGAGGEPHLQLVAQMVREIAREEGLHFPMALIHAEQDKDLHPPPHRARAAPSRSAAWPPLDDGDGRPRRRASSA